MPASDTYAEFYTHPWLNVAESRKAQRQIYEDKIYVEIKIKGDSNTSYSREKKDQDEVDYPVAWAKYTGADSPVVGTSLEHLPKMTPATIKNLNAQGIMSIEDLANLNDNVVIGVQGMLTLRKSAQAYTAALEPEEAPKKKRKRRKRNPETGELE